MELRGMAVIITGGEAGIGAESAVQIAKAGAAVTLTYLRDGSAAGELRRRRTGPLRILPLRSRALFEVKTSGCTTRLSTGFCGERLSAGLAEAGAAAKA